MIKQHRNKSIYKALALVTALAGSTFLLGNTTTYAKSVEENITGYLFEMGEDSDYEYTAEEEHTKINDSGSSYGKFNIEGELKSISDVNGYPAYEVSKDNISFKYKFDDKYIVDDEYSWHLYTDASTKTVDDYVLENKIKSGALILQSSIDGNRWVTDYECSDIRTEDSGFNTLFSSSKDIQLINGCYYRVIVAYETELREEDTVVLGVSVKKNYDYKRYVETYQFYLVDSKEILDNVAKPTDTPRKELGEKIKTGKDNGYSGSEAIDKNDPHYGWNIGTFSVNGYTRETAKADNTPVFLKNVGDRVTLWFNLAQNIDALNGDDNLTINENNGGYDQFFEIKKTNFKHGTLIIRFTDHEGVKHDPVIYTDYLAANAKTGADTKVELFEEGDYEVALDYEIKDSSGFIGSSYTDYRISFSFSIRNGNCMVYPFDLISGNELSDKAITENGFKLDMAKSRYLTIDVKKNVLKKSGDIFVEDERFNRPASDGEQYTDEGIYIFTVKNLFTNSDPTTKTIYVGSSPIMLALSRSGLSLDEINQHLSEGATIESDGTIIDPEPETTEEPTEDTTEIIIESTEVDNTIDETIAITAVESTKDSTGDKNDEINTTENQNLTNNTMPIVVICSVAFVTVVGIGFIIYKKKKDDNGDKND